MNATKELTIEERVAQKEFPPEYSCYGYVNDINTLGNSFFDSVGINESLLHLVAINKKPELFVGERFGGPSLWGPKINYRELKEIHQDEITVYFNDVQLEKVPKRSPGKWFELIHGEFLPLLEGFPAGIKVDYFYGDGASNKKVSSEFRDVKFFYQASVKLFDEAISAFSCFVSGDINISAWNHYEHPSFEKYGHTNFGVWKGTVEDFLESTAVLEEAIRTVDPSRPNSYQIVKGEIKLFHPELGLIAMRGRSRSYTVGNYSSVAEEREVIDPATLIVSKEALGKLEAEFVNWK